VRRCKSPCSHYVGIIVGNEQGYNRIQKTGKVHLLWPILNSLDLNDISCRHIGMPRPQIRNLSLYPTELRGRRGDIYISIESLAQAQTTPVRPTSISPTGILARAAFLPTHALLNHGPLVQISTLLTPDPLILQPSIWLSLRTGTSDLSQHRRQDRPTGNQAEIWATAHSAVGPCRRVGCLAQNLVPLTAAATARLRAGAPVPAPPQPTGPCYVSVKMPAGLLRLARSISEPPNGPNQHG
jgi:hypothetical protein